MFPTKLIVEPYLVMDIGILWGVFKYIRKEINAYSCLVITAIVIILIVLVSFFWIKAFSCILVVIIAFAFMAFIYFGEKWFLTRNKYVLENQNK